MRRLFPLAALLSACLTCVTVVARAQSTDQDLMIKWSAFTVIHYVVIGEFAGVPSGGGFNPRSATDRVELTFDWNQNETALVGTPTIKNFPGTMDAAPVANGVCPATAPRVTGNYDHLNLASATPLANTLELKGTRSHPTAVLLRMNERDQCVDQTVPATTEEVKMSLVVLPTVIFGMPAYAGAGVSISKDGKSFVAVDKENGWTWTYTPTGLK